MLPTGNNAYCLLLGECRNACVATDATNARTDVGRKLEKKMKERNR